MKKSVLGIVALGLVQGVIFFAASLPARADDSYEIMKQLDVGDNLTSVNNLLDIVIADLHQKKPEKVDVAFWLAGLLDEARKALRKDIPPLTQGERIGFYNKQCFIAVLLAQRFYDYPIDENNFAELRKQYVLTELKFMRRVLEMGHLSLKESQGPVDDAVGLSSKEETQRRANRAREANFLFNRFSVLNNTTNALMKRTYSHPPEAKDEYKRVLEIYDKIIRGGVPPGIVTANDGSEPPPPLTLPGATVEGGAAPKN